MNRLLTKAKFVMKDIPKPLGRWGLDHSKKQINSKIDLSNEDHCEPCGQYAIQKVETKKLSDDEILLVANTLT